MRCSVHTRPLDRAAQTRSYCALTPWQGLEFIMYGDSIMEAFRGQSVGWDASDRYSGNMEAWARLAPPK